MMTPTVTSPMKRCCQVGLSTSARTVRLVVCGLLLLTFSAPGILADAANSAARQAPSQYVAATTPADSPSALQSRRQEEIRQKDIDNPEAGDEANVYRHSPMVKKLAGIFGLSVEMTSRMFEIVNFIILAIGIVWLVGKILPKALRSRTERLRNEIENARVATEDAKRRLASVEERLSRLDSDINTIRTQAEQETVVEEKRLRAALEQEKQSILESAAQDIDAATKNAQSQLKKLAADLVIEHARRRISVTPEDDQTLVAGFLTDLNEKHPGGGTMGGGVN